MWALSNLNYGRHANRARSSLNSLFRGSRLEAVPSGSGLIGSHVPFPFPFPFRNSLHTKLQIVEQD